jgi:para-aminobenzoate synthetase component 1
LDRTAPSENHDAAEIIAAIKSLYAGPLRVQSEVVEIEESFLEFAGRFAEIQGTVLLQSGGDLDCARYNILGTRPFLRLASRGHAVTLSAGNSVFQLRSNPMDCLQLVLRHLTLDLEALKGHPPLKLPLQSGLMGYLTYDLKDQLEELPRTSVDDLLLPQMLFFAPSLLYIHDRHEKTTYRLVIQPILSEDLSEKGLDFKQIIDIPAKPDAGKLHFGAGNSRSKSNFNRRDYVQAVERIREYIASGDVYQVNMSQRFTADFRGSAFGFFKALFDKNPAPFFAYIHAGDHRIVSTSPERFIYRDKRYVETRPIKGTRPRGKTEKEDQDLRSELAQSKKDDAELSMIVDLLRNDLGRVCRGGSVHVTQHKRIEAYSNVYHLVSIVTGELDTNRDSADIIRATFPGGSITGCPKIRSMEIIDELEPNRRHIYTGSIGYISFHDTMDLNIAIRTATILGEKDLEDRRIVFSVGGGIVFDSDPADEYDETLHKGKTLMEVLDEGENSASPSTMGHNSGMVWLNGRICPHDQAAVPLTDLGLQYGFGFFETLRSEKGRICLLEEHLLRFNHTWRTLFEGRPPDVTWDAIIQEVLHANALDQKTAAVKILVTHGAYHKAPFDHNLAVTAREYRHRLEISQKPGLALGIYPEPRQTPLAKHKTLNYLYYFLAGKWAAANGYDEAIILNPDHTISETNTANLILLQGKKMIRPMSPAVLPGVVAEAVRRAMSRRGYREEVKPLSKGDLLRADEVWATNSLMGAVPALSVDGTSLPKPSDLLHRINGAIHYGV